MGCPDFLKSCYCANKCFMLDMYLRSVLFRSFYRLREKNKGGQEDLMKLPELINDEKHRSSILKSFTDIIEKTSKEPITIRYNDRNLGISVMCENAKYDINENFYESDFRIALRLMRSMETFLYD